MSENIATNILKLTNNQLDLIYNNLCIESIIPDLFSEMNLSEIYD